MAVETGSRERKERGKGGKEEEGYVTDPARLTGRIPSRKDTPGEIGPKIKVTLFLVRGRD